MQHLAGLFIAPLLGWHDDSLLYGTQIQAGGVEKKRLSAAGVGAFYLHLVEKDRGWCILFTFLPHVVAPVALSLKMTLIRHAVSLFPSKCTSMQWKFKHRRLKYAKVDSVLIKGFDAMFRSKNVKNWHTRCASWCNNYNLDNKIDNQCWQPILTTHVYNQCRQPILPTNVDYQWHCSGNLLISKKKRFLPLPYGTCTTHDQGVHQRKIDVPAGRQGGGSSGSRCI